MWVMIRPPGSLGATGRAGRLALLGQARRPWGAPHHDSEAYPFERAVYQWCIYVLSCNDNAGQGAPSGPFRVWHEVCTSGRVGP
jgi:hypothetical protein